MRQLRVMAVVLVASCGGNGPAAPDGGADAPSPPADGAPPPPGCGDAGAGGTPEATVPGAASLPSPTLRHLTLEWLIDGDTDLDGVVSVRYREVGGEWRLGLPLRRIPGGTV